MESVLRSTTLPDNPWNDDDVTLSPTEASFTPEEEDAIVTIVVVVFGVIIAIIAMFCMGIFMDCRDQKPGAVKSRHPLRLKMPPAGRRRGGDRRPTDEDEKSFAVDMCPNGISDPGTGNAEMIV